MAKVAINLRDNVDINELKNGSVLVYDNENKEFYAVTPETFFRKYDKKLTDLLKRYDLKVEELEKENQEFKAQQVEFIKNVQDINSKLIDMVEKFIKGDK